MWTRLCANAGLSLHTASASCRQAWLSSNLSFGSVKQIRSRGRQLPHILISTQIVCKRDTTSRPTLDDVERISRGDAAKSRGTGSRRIPHRLNAEERKQYDIAKQKGFLTVRGTGYRKERKGSPLANTFRQWCDASAKMCVVIEQGFGSDAVDTVLVDFSTLRSDDTSKVEDDCKEKAASLGCSLSQDQSNIPFTIEIYQGSQLPTVGNRTDEQQGTEHDQDVNADQTTAGDGLQSPSSTESQSDQTTASQGLDYTQLNSKQRKKLASKSPLEPIWMIQAQPISFDADRSTAKELAKALTADS